MAKYYVNGYTPPQGVNSGEDVATMQRQLNAMGAGLTVDGVYGPKTQAAYNSMGGGQGATSAPQQWANGVSDYMQGILPLFNSSYVSYTPQSASSIRGELEDALRPGVDASIKKRREQTEENRAELDADAWARGMGRSTYVTDVKDRQMDEEAEDIAELEAAYSAALAQAFLQAQENERARALQTQMYNASQQADVNRLAFSSAQDTYTTYMDMAAKASAGGSGKSGRSGDDETDKDAAALFLSLLSPEERTAIYEGATQKDRIYRDELIKSLGKSGFLQAQGLYPGA